MERRDWVSGQLPAAVLLQCLCLKHVIMCQEPPETSPVQLRFLNKQPLPEEY